MAQVQEIHLYNQDHPSQGQQGYYSSAISSSTNDHVITLSQNSGATLPDLQPPSESKKSFFISLLLILKNWRRWVVVVLFIISVLAGQTVATLLGRFYFDEGGKSLWMETIVQSAGAPLLILPLLLIPKKEPVARPPLHKIVPIYVVLGILIAADNLMYSYGLLYLPVSTYSLICATQLGFNAIFSHFINKQKFTALIFNSIVLLTFSATLHSVNSDSSDSNIPKDKYPLGLALTLGASAMFSLIVSLMQLTFETVIKAQTFSWVLELQMCCNSIASVITVAGLFISGEWRNITAEYEGYRTGKASYVLTLVGTADGWQMCSTGVVGLLSLVSSLFANVISTLTLPLVPVLAVIFFHDGMNGIKVMAMLIALWGFLSYIYQHYLDGAKSKKKIKEIGLNDDNQIPTPM